MTRFIADLKREKKESLPGWKRATPKQIAFLKYLMSKEEFSFIRPKSLTKEEASFMIKTLRQ